MSNTEKKQRTDTKNKAKEIKSNNMQGAIEKSLFPPYVLPLRGLSMVLAADWVV